MYIEFTGCCGVDELDGLSSVPKENIIDLCSHVFEEGNKKRAMYCFTDRISNGNGTALAKFIESEKLGTVQESKSKVNPNTGARIKLWIFYPNWKNLKSFNRLID